MIVFIAECRLLRACSALQRLIRRGTNILLVIKPVPVLIQRENEKNSCRHCRDDQNCSHDGDSHCVRSHGTIASHFFFGQRKPFTPPSNTLVLISSGSAQNSCPHPGHVRRYRRSISRSRLRRLSLFVCVSRRRNSSIPAGPRTKICTPHGSQIT